MNLGLRDAPEERTFAVAFAVGGLFGYLAAGVLGAALNGLLIGALAVGARRLWRKK